MADTNHHIVAIEEDDIDREAHEKHVHPHERLEPPAREEHSMARLEAIAAKQAARLTRNTSGILDILAQRGTARQIDCTNDSASHLVLLSVEVRPIFGGVPLENQPQSGEAIGFDDAYRRSL
jgi:hypothetical protein